MFARCKKFEKVSQVVHYSEGSKESWLNCIISLFRFHLSNIQRCLIVIMGRGVCTPFSEIPYPILIKMIRVSPYFAFCQKKLPASTSSYIIIRSPL